MNKLFKIPYWLIAVFSWDKSYRNNPIIGSYLLNKLGLHVFRVILSHALFSFRLWLLTPVIGKADRDFFKKNGFIVKHNFLPEDEFVALKEELLAYEGEIRELPEGDTIKQLLFLNKKTRSQLPQCQRFSENKSLNKLIRYCSSKNRLPIFYVENLNFHNQDSTFSDPQQNLHIDTFHPCVKGWLFIDDVDSSNGAHIYVPGSHRLTWKRLRWEYHQSLAQSLPEKNSLLVNDPTHYYWDGSFRITAEDLQSLNYGLPREFSVPANTLLIDNVHGFHSRGNPQNKSSRMTISMHARDNPFNPLITPCPQLTANIFEIFWQRILDKRDQQSTKKINATSSSRVYGWTKFSN